jgi:Fe-S oxidoreductase
MSATGASLLSYVIYAILFVVAWSAFANRVGQLVALIGMGQPAHFGNHWGRLKDFIVFVVVEAKVLQRRLAGFLHLLVFYGFIIITIQSAMMWIQGFFPDLEIGFIEFNPIYVLLLDLFDAIVIVSVLYFVFRRLVLRPRALTLSLDGYFILVLILFSAASDLTTNSFRYALAPLTMPHSGYAQVAPWAFISNNIGALLQGTSLSVADLQAGFNFGWWWHTLTVLAFLVYIPYSKHLHLFTAMLTTYFRNKSPKGMLPKIENIEEQEHYGVSEIDQFTWRNLLDNVACTECGRCQEACPAYATGKPLNPKAVILDLKDYMLEQGPKLLKARQMEAVPPATQINESRMTEAAHRAHDLNVADVAMVGDVITDDVLWACTTCQACISACPVFIEPMARIVDMRRYLVLEQSRFPAEVNRTFTNMERNGNLWEFPAAQRGDWAKPLNIPTLAEAPDAEIVFFVGCFGSFDQRNRKTVEAFARILQAAGIKFAILGKEEKCNGDPARRIGNEYLYQTLAQENIETMNGYHVKKVVTACPHCFNTIKNEYPQFGGHYEVLHHTQLIDQLIKEGRIQLSNSIDEKVTYHDPCYLGRYNDEYDAPREILTAIPGIRLEEMPRNRQKSFCCGGGGGRIFMEEHIGKRINNTRMQEAADTGASTLAAACPFCMSMFEDARKSIGVQEEIRTQDVAELVARAMAPRQPGQADAVPMRGKE